MSPVTFQLTKKKFAELIDFVVHQAREISIQRTCLESLPSTSACKRSRLRGLHEQIAARNGRDAPMAGRDGPLKLLRFPLVGELPMPEIVPNRKPFAPHLSLHIEVALAFLRHADDSRAEEIPKTVRSVRADWLIRAGSSVRAIDWLVSEGFVHDVRGNKCAGQLGANNGTDVGAQLVLSDRGLQLARELASSPLRPRWDATRRELWLGERLVKRLRGVADNQALVLAAFAEEDWPSHVDDPIPPLRGHDSHKRLRNVVQRLNNAQVYALLRFHGSGTGDGVRWQLALPRPDGVRSMHPG